MEPSLQDVWEGAAGSPFVPIISKDNQFFIGIILLLLGILLTGLFGLSKFLRMTGKSRVKYTYLLFSRSITGKYSSYWNTCVVGNWVC